MAAAEEPSAAAGCRTDASAWVTKEVQYHLNVVKHTYHYYYQSTASIQNTCSGLIVYCSGLVSSVILTDSATGSPVLNIKMWTELPVKESIRTTETNGESTSMVWLTLGSRTPNEQNRTSSSARGPKFKSYRRWLCLSEQLLQYTGQLNLLTMRVGK